jgi:hypothetical protein
MGLRLPKTTLPDDRHAAWVRVVERIRAEQVSQAWHDQLFRLVRAVFTNNRTLSDQGGFLFNWMKENYGDASLMVVRRELDKQRHTENLRHLLEDIIEHPEVLTRARYVAQWPRAEAHLADGVFDQFTPAKVPGSPHEDYIDPNVVKADLDRVIDDAARVRDYAERTRAHRTPEQGLSGPITFRDLRQALVDIRSVVGKYYALLTLMSVTEWEPVAQYDTIAPFTRAWVTDAAAVERAVDEEPTE